MSLTPEELELRQTGIGSSDIAAVAGLSPWSGPIDVYQKKVGEDDGFTGNWSSEVGHQLEPLIGSWYADEVGAEKLIPGNTVVHPDKPWILATPDFYVILPVLPKRITEIKNVGFRVAHHWDDGPPEYVQAQVHWQQETTGIHFADVAASIAAQEPAYWQVENSPEIRKDLVEIGRDFWFEHVLKRVPPEPDDTEQYKTYLNKNFSDHSQEIIPVDSHLNRWFVARAEAKDNIKTLEASIREAENQIKAVIGSNAGLKTDRWKATWKRGQGGSVSWKKIAEDLGATESDIDKHRGQPARTFLAKELK